MKERLISFWHYSQANTLVSTLEYNSAEGAGGKKIRGSLHQDDSSRDQPGGAQIVRALVQLHREVLGHVPGDVEGIHRGGQAGDQEDGAAGEEDDEMSHNEPLPSDDAGESVNNDHTYCVPK